MGGENIVTIPYMLIDYSCPLVASGKMTAEHTLSEGHTKPEVGAGGLEPEKILLGQHILNKEITFYSDKN